MSDIPGGAPDTTPGSAQIEDAQTGGGLIVMAVSDFIIAWESPQTSYPSSTLVALQWTVSVSGGDSVPTPDGVVITLTYPDATQQNPATTYINSGSPLPTLIIGGVLPITEPGLYIAEIALTFDGLPLQTREGKQVLVCLN